MIDVSDARVLVVDDTPANVRLLKALLGQMGCQVDSAADGPAALEAAATRVPDLVLLDIQMPGMNGYEVLRRLRERAATAMVPIVVVTAAGNEEKLAALDAGADDFLARPFERAELEGRVRSLLRVKRYHDTIEAQRAELEAWVQTLEARVHEQVAELEGFRLLRRYLPAPLAGSAIDAGDREVLEPHRCEISVLQAMLHGFQEVCAGSDPEEAVRVLREFHDVVGGLVTPFGATVDTVRGGSVVLYFNDLVPSDAPVRAAIQLATELRARLEPRREEWRRRGHELALGCGVSFGFATLGTIGFEGRFDYAPVGVVVDHAALLAGAASDGEILLTQRAAGELGEAAELVPGAELSEGAGGRPVRSVLLLRAPGGSASPPSAVQLDLLGPLVLRCGDQVVEIRASRERQVLAVLAAHHGAIVSVDRLADELWDGAPGDSAVSALRVHVSRLRKTLTAAGVGEVLHTKDTGYVLSLGDDQAVDVARFERLASIGHEELGAGDAERAVTTLRSALALWRGPVLVDLPDMPSTTAMRMRLAERRLVVLEQCIEAEIAVGRHREVLPELESLVLEHPLRERFWALRMLALYRSGRQTEALRAYQDLRDILVEESGLEPSKELAELERLIVEQSSELAPARVGGTSAAAT